MKSKKTTTGSITDKKEQKTNRRAPHNHQHSRCKECVGGSICEHKRRRSQCKDSVGGSFCASAARERNKAAGASASASAASIRNASARASASTTASAAGVWNAKWEMRRGEKREHSPVRFLSRTLLCSNPLLSSFQFLSSQYSIKLREERCLLIKTNLHVWTNCTERSSLN